MKNRSIFLIVNIVFIFSWTGPSLSKAQTQPGTNAPTAINKPGLGDFDDFVNEALKDWKVPGVAVAVIHGDKVILLKGYGYRDMEKRLPVTPDTLFGIGSITKSFTVTALGMEMDEGKVDWDKPVRDYLPTFKMIGSVLTCPAF